MAIVFDEIQAEVAPPGEARPSAGSSPAPGPGADDPKALDDLERSLAQRERLNRRLSAD
jgi:hypothetical protein